MSYQKLIDEIVDELYRKLKQDIKLTSSKERMILIGQGNAEEISKLEEVYEVVPYEAGKEIYGSIIICNMSIGLLARLAQGISTNDEEEFILRALLEGKMVYVLEGGIEYRKYKTLSYKALYTLYSDYENKIKQYGIRTIGHMTDILMTTKQPIPIEIGVAAELNEEVDFTQKKLLLESDLMKAHVSPYMTILVSKKGIVTPLAEDFIRTHKLKIKRV